MLKMLNAAVVYAISQGAHVVEGYPLDTAGDRKADASAYTGLLPPSRKRASWKCSDATREDLSCAILRTKARGNKPCGTLTTYLPRSRMIL